MADFRVMLPLAAAMVNQVLQSGEHKHGNSWETQLISTHREHHDQHLRDKDAGIIMDGQTKETNTSHAVVRLLFELEMELRELELDKREARRRARKQKAVTTG